MRIATISHSHIALRQQLFFQEVARQGHEVLMISPGEWGSLKTLSHEIGFAGRPHLDSIGHTYRTLGGNFSLKTCRHIGDNIYDYRLLGAKELVEEFDPDWLYVQAEPWSLTAVEAWEWKAKKRAIFTWENIRLKATASLPKYDLVVCGNPDAEALVKPYNPNTVLLLQVGVDTDHFAQRPVERTINVAYIGRSVPEKGLPYLGKAYPGVYVLEWKDFRELPWWYSQVKVVVAYSQDTPWWREQAPNYVVLEALSCGSKAIISDTAAMKFWLEGCPGVVLVEGHEQSDMNLRADRIIALREGIQKALDMEIGDKGRQWVIERFSNPIIAKKLLEVLSASIILFVCNGNACRSRLAEAIFNHIAPKGWRAISAGYRPSPVTNPAVSVVLGEIGISFIDRSPQKLTAELSEKADMEVDLTDIEDPVLGESCGDTSEECLEAHRQARDKIVKRVKAIIPEIGQDE